MISGHTLTLDHVAALLQMTPERFGSRRGQLYRKGFPRPLPGCGNIWSARRVLAWIDRDDSDESESVAPEHGHPQIIELDRQALLKRYGPGAGSGVIDDPTPLRSAAFGRSAV
jgi:hypothetical protein